MIKIATKLSPKQIEEAFNRLSAEEKLKLVEEFERKTRKKRWEKLTQEIRSRVKNKPISQKEINRICESVRTNLYESKTQGRR